MPFFKRRSLAFKIPLLISVLLLIALTAMSAASYLELRTALVEIATGRLQQAADQMAGLFATSSRQRVAALKQFTERQEVRGYLRSRDPALVPKLEADVKTYLGTALAIANVELWDPAGRRVFAFGAPFEEVAGPRIEEYRRDVLSGAEPEIGMLRPFEEGVRYPVGGQVLDDGKLVGYAIERRRISNPAQSRQTIALLTGLIGREATMLIGNADGSVWSDLATTVTGIPATGPPEGRLWTYERAGRPEAYAWATPVSGTPWTVVIEFPRDEVLGPSRRFLRRSVVIATLVLLIAAALGWVTSRRMTKPLAQVAEAAAAVAESKPHVPLAVDRSDEVGRLADSFNIMAAKVAQARTDLELRVELRTAELRAANRELEAFSYTVSHDLRAPLRAIAGFVQILEEDQAENLDASARHHLERVKLNARRMGQLIDDLLSFSQIGRTTMLRQSVDLGAVAKTAAHDAIAASGRQIELTIDELPFCYGEAGLLNQVLVNLISNAVKFTAKTERPAIHIGARIANGETVYFVRDNGAGFDDRFVEKLFGVFQRLHKSEEFEGTGVGLAIVHRIISRHGGRVWAEGKPNAGATFYFTIPSSGKASPPHKATEDPVHGTTLKA